MLKEQMQNVLQLLGLNSIVQPLFYNCQYGIRFEIGVGDIYDKDMTPRKVYVKNALSRAMTIYNSGVKNPALLMCEIYPEGEKDKNNFEILFSKRITSILPQEKYSHDIDIDDDNTIKQTQLFWDLKKSKIPMEKLFREIILGDIGV